MKLKTAEIVVDEKPCGCRPGYRDKDMVAIVVGYTEKTLREALKSAGGRWDPAEKLWRVSYGAIKANPDLIERIVKEDAGYRYR